MLIKVKLKPAQSTLEYALLIAVVVGALLTMQNYLKRSIMDKVRSSGDDIGEQYSPNLTSKYDKSFSNLTQQMTEETTRGHGQLTNTVIGAMTQEQNATRDIQSLDTEVWK